MKKLMNKRACTLCLLLMFLCPLTGVQAQEDGDMSARRLRDMYGSQGAAVTWDAMDDIPYLTDYLALHQDGKDYQGEDVSCRIETDGAQQTTMTVDVPEEGFYTLRWTYVSEEASNDLFAAFTLDGQIPYQEAASACFSWEWNEVSPPIRNAIGDDARPRQQRLSSQNTLAFTNPNGYVPGPLPFYLTAGQHQFTLTFSTRPVTIESCMLCAIEQTDDYETVIASAVENGYQMVGQSITFEAEDTIISKSSSVIQRTASDDPMSTPYEMGYKRLNTIGGQSFSKGGQSVTWRFSVPEEGLYALAFRYNALTEQMPVFRTLYIDGKLPFSEAISCRFDNQDALQLTLFPYLLPLTAGEHTMTLVVDISPYYPIILAARNVSDTLAQYVLDIIMMVGTNPDSNYDYEISKAMPSLSDDLKRMSAYMLEQAQVIHEICGRTCLIEGQLIQFSQLLLGIEKNMNRIQNSLIVMNSIQSSLSQGETMLSTSPLQIDRFMLGTQEDAKDPQISSIAHQAQAVFYNFLLSFSKDYDQVGGRTDGKEQVVLDVWAGMSIEAADVLKELCDATFTPQTGIGINLNIMPSGQLNAGSVNALLLSLVSHSQPDVALGVSANTPVELAIRDAVVDLSKLPGFDELAAQMPEKSLLTNTFAGGVYGLPERIDFTVMFYRKDILSALALSLPECWEDVYNQLLPALYQNSLQMYIPHDFSTFLYQYGGQYYSEDGLSCALDTPQGYQAFKSMTDLYVKYAIPYTTNFFNRFRSGEIPIGVSKFGDYMSLTVGAANLSGKWGVAQIPGVRQADGTVNHATANMVTASSVIMSACENQEAAWEFMKWWLSAQTQESYCREVEMRIGTGSRIPTSNTEAFSALNWPVEDLPVLLAAREANVEAPGVLGGSYTARHITNAWNAVILDSNQGNVRDEYEHAIEMIQSEMESKQREYKHLLKH